MAAFTCLVLPTRGSRQRSESNAAWLDCYDAPDNAIPKLAQSCGRDARSRRRSKVSESEIHDAMRLVSLSNDKLTEVLVGRDQDTPLPIGFRQDLVVVRRGTDIGRLHDVETLAPQLLDDGAGDALVCEE
jgi:hypothetical protein